LLFTLVPGFVHAGLMPFPNDVEFLFCHAAKVRVATQKKTGWLVAIRSNWKFITVVYEVKKSRGAK